MSAVERNMSESDVLKSESDVHENESGVHVQL